MIETYDILVNFKRKAYEFYEWSKNDDIKNIKVIPSFKITDKALNDILFYDVIVDKTFLKKIEDKTKFYCNRLIKNINYACVFFNDLFALAVQFDHTGKIIGKSRLLFDEESDVINKGQTALEEKIDYNIISNYKEKCYHTRKEDNIISIISKYLDILYDQKREDEIKYIYLECFNLEENNLNLAYQRLKKQVISGDFSVIDKLKVFMKVLKR